MKPDDDLVLEAAVNGGCAVLVTQHVRYFIGSQNLVEPAAGHDHLACLGSGLLGVGEVLCEVARKFRPLPGWPIHPLRTGSG